MKKFGFLIAAAFLFSACGNDSGNNENDDRNIDQRNTDAGDVEDYSGKNISPQLEDDSAGTFDVDSVSNAESIDKRADDARNKD